MVERDNVSTTSRKLVPWAHGGCTAATSVTPLLAFAWFDLVQTIALVVATLVAALALNQNVTRSHERRTLTDLESIFIYVGTEILGWFERD